MNKNAKPILGCLTQKVLFFYLNLPFYKDALKMEFKEKGEIFDQRLLNPLECDDLGRLINEKGETFDLTATTQQYQELICIFKATEKLYLMNYRQLKKVSLPDSLNIEQLFWFNYCKDLLELFLKQFELFFTVRAGYSNYPFFESRKLKIHLCKLNDLLLIAFMELQNFDLIELHSVTDYDDLMDNTRISLKDIQNINSNHY